MMSKNLVVKTVEIPPKAQRASRTGDSVPYPIDYCNQHADFDIWHHMFLVNHLGDLTMHQFSQPPAVVLDLGCGTGYWAIEAAKKWPDSTIYGYDIKKIQPEFSRMGKKFQSFATRIEWIHGNFLNGLPFPSNHFDFVRIAGLGLAIPEDEWQTVLEDVRRVLKPGAVLEVIEEDLLFPCSSALLQKPPEPSSPSSLSGGQLPIFDLYTNQSPYREIPNVLYPTTRRKLYRTTSADSFYDASRSTITDDVSTVFSMLNSRQPPSVVLSTPSLRKSISDTDHPQDHTRLKTAWDAMLATRFLAPNLLSVIPFYLTSSSFVDTKAHESLTIALPPNSGVIPTRNPQPNLNERFSCPGRRSIKADGFTFHASLSPVVQPQPSIAASMHLAKTVNTIRGCKEAIWKEYNKLYSADASHILSRIAPDEDNSFQQPVHISRKAFEVDWRNWDLDMIDRIDMRNNLSTHVLWVPSIPDTKDDCPDWVTWRETLDGNSERNRGHLIAGHDPSDSCRSLRIFTGVKPHEEVAL